MQSNALETDEIQNAITDAKSMRKLAIGKSSIRDRVSRKLIETQAPTEFFQSQLTPRMTWHIATSSNKDLIQEQLKLNYIYPRN